MSTFEQTRQIKAVRKLHRCEHCYNLIRPGEPAVRVSGLYDDFYSLFMHPECHEAAIGYAEVTGYWGEEFTYLVQLEEPEDIEWLKTEYPVAYARLASYFETGKHQSRIN